MAKHYRHEVESHYRGGVKPTASPLPPSPPAPQQVTKETDLSSLTTNNRKAHDNLHVHPSQSPQGLYPLRPPPPPPKHKILTKQDTVDELQSSPAEEPLYIDPDELQVQSDPVEESLYIVPDELQYHTQGLYPLRPPPPPPKHKILTQQDTVDELQSSPAEEPLYIDPDELQGQGLYPLRPPPPPPKHKILTKQDTVDELQSSLAEEPLYIDPDELQGQSDPVEESLYIVPDELQYHTGLHPVRPPPPPPKHKILTKQDTVDELQSSPAEEPLYIDPDELQGQSHRPSLHHSVSDNPSGPWYNNAYPSPLGLQHQHSLPAILPRGLENTQKVSKEELDLLLEWWSTVKETEHISHQVDEKNVTAINAEAQRVRLALHLFEGLLFYRGQVFNDHITQLYCMADKLDALQKKTRIAGIVGGTTAVGGVAAVAGVALAPFTFGISLAVAAVGVGVATAGGMTGASMAIKNKVSNTRERKKVEEMLQDHKNKMEDVEACLKFIDTGMERLRKYNLGIIRGMDREAMRVLRVAQLVGSQSVNLRPTGKSSGVLDGFAMSMDIYFTKEDMEVPKKGLETKFARRIRELAKQLKNGLDELMQIRDTVRSALDQVVTREVGVL